ncbi:MAG: MotA/TolQ/ExbB proton channel family protein [Polyangiaceae bacterium]|jgi:hypothetical protein
MPTALFEGLSLVDTTGRLILATTLACLLLGAGATFFVRSRYASMERDLRENGPHHRIFAHRVLNLIVRDADDALRRAPDRNTQAIIEDNFQSELKPLLFAERFVKSATGLVIILGLLGTFYGLTLSVGRLVHLVSSDAGEVADVSHALTTGLTQALTGMAVAFSNSLLGIGSAVVLTLVSVLFNVTDRRIALMVQLETYLDRLLPARTVTLSDPNLERAVVGFGECVARLDAAVQRFESALHGFASNTREFHVQIVASKPHDGR